MQPAKILIVEDDFFLGDSLVNKLEKQGYEVTALVSNRTDAIASIRKNTPDIAIVDIELEKKNSREKEPLGGVDLVRKINQTFNIPCIYYTGHWEEQEYFEEAQATHHNGIVAKTDSFSQLILTIKTTLDAFWKEQIANQLPDFLFMDMVINDRGRVKKTVHRVVADEISFIQYEEGQILVYVNGFEKHFTKSNKQLTSFLKSYPFPYLMQIYGTIIINTNKISKFDAGTDCVYVWWNGKEKKLPISKTYAAEFKRYIKSNYLK